MMKLSFSGHQRDGRIRCFFLSYDIHRVQIGSNCPDGICQQMDYCLVVMIKGKLISFIYFTIYKQIWISVSTSYSMWTGTPFRPKAITRPVYNAVGIYAPGHARYNEVDLCVPRYLKGIRQ